ncbi:type III PLP-dependent enzyme [Anaeroselena agilis]|uniref:ornithine decarboxylase n=1 Tax=Anaeroselena agilis TaxID=3063788 RepID=A0ABU3P4Q7_9FIRM|nr:type III PLP-dependent enzyme [Selenomonadales bacterium 4137-cl]
MQSYFKLTRAATESLAEKYGTPLLVLSLDQVKANYRFLTEHLPGVKVHYAVKANPERRLVAALAEEGARFDVASDGEMLDLAAMGVSPDRIIYANPIKTAGGLAVARRTGVNKFTFDSENEIGRIARAIPGGTVLLRIKVENPQALVDLNKKFGAPPEDALRLLRLAREQGLDVAGLCFHVGSQSMSAKAYTDAIKVCRRLADAAAADGFKLRYLDIGGGFPIPTPQDNVDVAAMASEIRASLAASFPDTEIWSEPGRFICGTAVNLITSVIGIQTRNSQLWYFLDEGLYGTFSGVIFDHWDFELESFRAGERIAATFAGPSCDSFDVMFRDKPTVPLAVDDVILVPNCGAYTSASATTFNGFSKANILIWEEVRAGLAVKV